MPGVRVGPHGGLVVFSHLPLNLTGLRGCSDPKNKAESMLCHSWTQGP